MLEVGCDSGYILYHEVQQHYRDALIRYQAFLPMLLRSFDMEKMMARTEAAKEMFRNRWSPYITMRNNVDCCNIADS